MQRTLAILLFSTVALTASRSHADLQNVEVGGSITILGEYFRNACPPDDGLRWPGATLLGRPIGHAKGITSFFSWDDEGPGCALVSQWSRLHISADFTSDVRAFIELDSVDVWGEDFRSEYLTGADSRSTLPDDVEVYQSYIEANEMFGLPLRARIGRQELRFGSEWLVGANDSGPCPAWGLSFDALRLTYATELFQVDMWGAKLADRSPSEEDGDTDFYGIYGSFLGIEGLTLDAYWMFLRDAAALKSTERGLFGEWLEDRLGLDDYDTTALHTVGLRAAGEYGAFDFEVEAAYQFGNAASTAFRFRTLTYGEDDAEYDAWACNLNLGYTADLPWQPRFYFGYAYFQGQDNRDTSFGEWARVFLNPFHAHPSSVSFNRLFSNVSYSGLLDCTETSNVHFVHVGVEASPTDSLDLALDLGYYRTDETFDRPMVPGLPFLTRSNDAELGWEVDANMTYHYSDDLSFTVGWDHLFVGDGLRQGNFGPSNGLDFNGGSDGKDADYWYWETSLAF